MLVICLGRAWRFSWTEWHNPKESVNCWHYWDFKLFRLISVAMMLTTALIVTSQKIKKLLYPKPNYIAWLEMTFEETFQDKSIFNIVIGGWKHVFRPENLSVFSCCHLTEKLLKNWRLVKTSTCQAEHSAQKDTEFSTAFTLVKCFRLIQFVRWHVDESKRLIWIN